jgi:hypothetical protein
MIIPFLEQLTKDPERIETLTAILWPAEFYTEEDLEATTKGVKLKVVRRDGRKLTKQDEETVSIAIISFEHNLISHLEA